MMNNTLSFTGEVQEPKQTIQGGEIVTLQSIESPSLDIPVFVRGIDGISVENIVWNSDYTFTIFLSNGSQYVSPVLKGTGIQSIVLNSDYTLTFFLDNGESFTTDSIRGPEGPPGPPGETFPDDGTLGQVLTKTDEGVAWQDVVSNPTSTYVHRQYEASSLWYIQHNLGKYPSITIMDSASTIVYGDIEYVDLDNVILRFNCAFSGKAVLT